MKKLLLSMLAMTLMVVSCQRDANLDYEGKDAVSVTIGVTPVDLNVTRSGETQMNSAKGAISNFSADEWAMYDLRYMLEVYDVATNTLVKERAVNIHDAYEATKFELRLIPDRDYNFVVWADVVPEDTTADWNYDTSDFANIHRTARAESVAMDECLDAYFINEVIHIENSLPHDLVLTRPFGKVRVVTTDIDKLNLGSSVERVVVNFYNHPIFASLNATTGAVSAERANVSYEYNLAKDAPYSEGYDALAQNQTLFADYLLADTDFQEINFTMEIYEAGDRLIRERDFNTQIPLGRNNLTTIIGNLLTVESDFHVEVDNTFDNEIVIDNLWDGNFESLPAAGADGYIEITTPGQFATLLASDPDGKKVRLMDDVNFGGEVLTIYHNASKGNNAPFELDGNGKTIYNYVVNDGVSAGLFADLVGAYVHDLTLSGGVVKPAAQTRASGDFYAGALVGRTYGTCRFENITVQDCAVEGVNKVGGLIGNVAEGSVEVRGSVVDGSTVATCSTVDGGCVGGLVGYVTGNAKFENNAVRNTTINAINSANEAKRANAEFIGAFHGNGKTLTLNANVCEGNTFTEAETSYVAPEGFRPWLGGVRYMDGSDVVVDGESLINIPVAVPLATPVVTTETSGRLITLLWEAVEGAANYSISVDGINLATIEACSYQWEGDYETEYQFEVVALPADEQAYLASEAAEAVVTTLPLIVLNDMTYCSINFTINCHGSYRFYCLEEARLGMFANKLEDYLYFMSPENGVTTYNWVDNEYYNVTIMRVYPDADHIIVAAECDENGNITSDIYTYNVHTPAMPQATETVDTTLSNITATSVHITTTPSSGVAGYYVWVKSKSDIEYYISAAGEAFLSTLIKNQNAGSWYLTTENSAEWQNLQPNTEYKCLVLTIDNEGRELMTITDFVTTEEVVAPVEYIYLKPNSNWTQAGARFAIYSWNDSGDMWVDMYDTDGDGIYEVEKSALNGNTNIIFCRMNPSATANNWSNKWNQTNDLTVPADGKNLFTVSAGVWDGNGTWSVK